MHQTEVITGQGEHLFWIKFGHQIGQVTKLRQTQTVKVTVFNNLDAKDKKMVFWTEGR
ncbi:hypothetical protein N836_13340 [Leptolyngbya sp. Heron Island J]|nr:hypothetical protein N836_13340 [Leptolyngbya sp. Heron Island J]